MGKKYRIAYLVVYPVTPNGVFKKAFVPALHNLGYVEGDNLVLQVKSANDRPERCARRRRRHCHGGDSELRAAKRASDVVPIVMAPSGDPVGAGYVASLARPGANITGLSWQSPSKALSLPISLSSSPPDSGWSL